MGEGVRLKNENLSQNLIQQFSNLFVGLFPHKVFHIHPVDGLVLFLGFLKGLIDWTEARFKIVIDIAYDVISW